MTIVISTQPRDSRKLRLEAFRLPRRRLVGDQLIMNRRKLLKLGAAGTALGASSLLLPAVARADFPESQQVGEIYQLQAAFHRAKTTQGSRPDDVALGRRRHLRQHDDGL